MRRDADAANVDLDAMAGTEGDSSETTVAHALNRDSRHNAQDSEEDERAQVRGDQQPKDERDGGNRHILERSIAPRRADSGISSPHTLSPCHAVVLTMLITATELRMVFAIAIRRMRAGGLGRMR